jgi:hypothetical protein
LNAKNESHFLLFLASHTTAQVKSGTIVIINVSKDRIIVVADSRGTNEDTGTRNNCECKIFVLGNRMVFTNVGNARRAALFDADPVKSWDNTKLAKEVFLHYEDTTGERRVLTISTAWGYAIASDWQLFYKAYPTVVPNLASERGGLTLGVFIEADGGTLYIKGARVKFTPANKDDPISTEIGDPGLSNCGEANRVCALGKHLDVASRFCGERKPHDELRVRAKLDEPNDDVRLAVKLVELTIDCYEKTPSAVGGDVDVLTLKNDGKIIWNHRKSNCLFTTVASPRC